MSSVLKERLCAYFSHHNDGFYIDDPTIADLDLDEVFLKIDNTSSSLGQEILYHRLRCPLFDKKSTDELEEDIKRIGSDKDALIKSEKELSNLSKLKNISVFEYLYKLDEVKPPGTVTGFLPLILMVLALLSMTINVTIGMVLSVVVFSVNTSRYFVISAKIKKYLICFKYLSDSVKAGSRIPYADKKEGAHLYRAVKGSFILGNIGKETANGGTGSFFDLFFDLIKMGFHVDIIKFYSMHGRILKERDEWEKYLYDLGYIDFVISIIRLREKNKYCIPHFTDDKKICAENAYHPLLEDPVPNSIDTDKSILLTGANASGKSTFLKSIAICAIMAQSLNTCFADGYEGAFFRVISSMSHTDDILKNESYYMAEAKAMKRILDLTDASDDRFVLCFVDEILSGTNTIERISAGDKILAYLDNKGAIVFAATHDIELTYLLEDKYRNFHFREEVSGDDITFSYKLFDDRASSSNAIMLLKMMDFPPEIVEEALNMSDELRSKRVYDSIK